MNALPVVALNGLRADSLGVYLASLGLFSLTARQWPRVRAVWRNASFCLVGGPATLEQAVEFVSDIGQRNAWTRYDKPWDKAKREDVKESNKGRDKKTSRHTALWRAMEADEQSIPLFGAHLALDDRVRMNPLLGTGGNAGKRDFEKGWRNAVQRIESPTQGWNRRMLNNDLEAFLSDGSSTCLDAFHAGSWFGVANKIYNHGNPSTPSKSSRGVTQPYREGEITPWAMVLACEGLRYFAGGPSRQLGSRRQPKGAFPFVTVAMEPKSAGEAGGIDAEIWAPIWDQPMTEPEMRALFLRGRAEIGSKGAVSSATFATGIMHRGVDAGITEFRRFLLLHTTSAQTFESRLATIVPVSQTSTDHATTRATEAIVRLYDALPPDRKAGKRWRFFGLRGPLEQALVDFAAAQSRDDCTEQAWALVDGVIGALAKVDQNRTFRIHNVRFRLLPGSWAAKLFRKEPPDREARLALAISSLPRTPSISQFIEYRIGVKKRKGNTLREFIEPAPTRIWSNAELTENLGAMAEKRIMEALRKTGSRAPFGATIRAPLDDVHAWLSGEVDEGRMRLWLDRLCVFDWTGETNREAAGKLRRISANAPLTVDGVLALYALFRPLASDWLFRQVLHENGIQAEKMSTCAHLGGVIAMLRHGDVNAAVNIAVEAYRSAGVTLADFSAFSSPDPGRLLAALVIPVRDEQVRDVFRRWRSPTEPTRE